MTQLKLFLSIFRKKKFGLSLLVSKICFYCFKSICRLHFLKPWRSLSRLELCEMKFATVKWLPRLLIEKKLEKQTDCAAADTSISFNMIQRVLKSVRGKALWNLQHFFLYDFVKNRNLWFREGIDWLRSNGGFEINFASELTWVKFVSTVFFLLGWAGYRTWDLLERQHRWPLCYCAACFYPLPSIPMSYSIRWLFRVIQVNLLSIQTFNWLVGSQESWNDLTFIVS